MEGLCVSVSHGLLNCDVIGVCCAWGDGGFTAAKKDGGRKAAADGGHIIGPGSIDTGNEDPIFGSKLSCMPILSLNPVKLIKEVLVNFDHSRNFLKVYKQ